MSCVSNRLRDLDNRCTPSSSFLKIKYCDEISKLIKAFPKDIAALDKRSVLAKVNSQGSGR